MTSRAKTSVQGSRSLSPHAEEVMESQDESLQSEQDEDLEVSFHPRCTPVPPTNLVGPPSIPTQYVYALYRKAHEWTGQSMMICTTVF